MIKNSISIISCFFAVSICLQNSEVYAGINKKDFKSKTVSELIDVLDNNELLERKVMEKVDKKLMCKFQLASFPQEVQGIKENLEMTSQYLTNDPVSMKEAIRQSEKLTISSLKTIDKYCN
tara:strand:+ start:70 stop:432 length:363 start_codon:yes stop_codon:yes gene_type:complete